MEGQDIAELFLSNFMNSLMEVQSSKIKIRPINSLSKNHPSMQKPIISFQKKEERLKVNTIMQKSINLGTNISKPAPIIEKPKSKPMKFNYSTTQGQIYATDKLNSLMRDPYINEIECLGTDSPLVVKKSGISQKTQINLSVDEIYEIIAEFSQKTRIPIINGRIKAAFNDMIITAVLSENLGPRFIIQKKMRPLII